MTPEDIRITEHRHELAETIAGLIVAAREEALKVMPNGRLNQILQRVDNLYDEYTGFRYHLDAERIAASLRASRRESICETAERKADIR